MKIKTTERIFTTRSMATIPIGSIGEIVSHEDGYVIVEFGNDVQLPVFENEYEPYWEGERPKLSGLDNPIRRELDVISYVLGILDDLGGDGQPLFDTLDNALYRLKAKANTELLGKYD